MSLLTFNKLFRVLAGVVLGVIIGLVFSSLIFKINVEDNNLPKGLIASSFHDAVEKTSPSVVNIYSDVLVNNRRSQFPFSDRFNSILGFNKARIESSLGSGVIFYSNGYILTNQHVIGDRSIGITVELASGQKEEAKVIGIDKGTDLAVLKIDNIQELSSIEIANSDNLKIGDIVLAIGNPYGVGQSVSMGIVSATGREFNNPYSDYIQTDASINVGNSGGPLFDMNGDVIGINTAILGQSGSIGIGFAIPANSAKKVINQLIEFGETKIAANKPKKNLTVKVELHKVTPYTILWTGQKQFTQKGQEETFLRFRIDSKGNLILPFRFEEKKFVHPIYGLQNVVPINSINAHSEENDNNDDEVRDAWRGF